MNIKKIIKTGALLFGPSIACICIIFCVQQFSRYVSWKNKCDESEKQSISSEEKQETISEESVLVEETKVSDSKLVFTEEFLVDNQEVTIWLSEHEGELAMSVRGSAETEEKATLMLVVFISQFKELNVDYSISVKCGQENIYYMKNGESINILSTNKDGSLTLSMPDWVVSDFTMPEEEANNYAAEILKALKEFDEKCPHN